MKPTLRYHRFLDEAGDTTFYGKGRIPIIGTNGVSQSFSIGMVTFNEPLDAIRTKINTLATMVEQSPLYRNVPSVRKRAENGGFYFHAKDDLPELRKDFFDLILTIDCAFTIIVGRKNPELFDKKHNGKENELYVDLLSHLLVYEYGSSKRLVFNIAERSNSTAIHNLEKGLQRGMQRLQRRQNEQNEHGYNTNIAFMVHKYQAEPLLSVADYLCWVVQRVFEKSETRFYDYLKPKINEVIDLYDYKRRTDSANIYNAGNPLSVENRIGPHTP